MRKKTKKVIEASTNALKKRARAGKAEVSKSAAQYTQVLLRKGAKVVEQGIDAVGQGAETIGNVILKPFRSS